jgi:hypothetical protein
MGTKYDYNSMDKKRVVRYDKLSLVTFFSSLKGKYCDCSLFMERSGNFTFFVASVFSNLRSRVGIPLAALLIVCLVLNGIITNVSVKAQLQPFTVGGLGLGTVTYECDSPPREFPGGMHFGVALNPDGTVDTARGGVFGIGNNNGQTVYSGSITGGAVPYPGVTYPSFSFTGTTTGPCRQPQTVTLTGTCGTDQPITVGSIFTGTGNVTCALPPTQTTITSATDGNGNPVQNGGSTSSPSITFQVTATPGSTPIAGFLCSLDGGAFGTCSSTNPATISYGPAFFVYGGHHTFAVSAVDTQGLSDSNPATFSWTINIQPPTHTTITSATDGNGNPVQNGGSTSSPSITFQVTATPGTDPITGFQCNLDGSGWGELNCANTNPATISYNNLAAGQQHTFAVRAVAQAIDREETDPNPATFSWSITELQPPTHTTITSSTDGNGNPVQNGGSTVSPSITFQVTATPGSNPIERFECGLDVSSFSTCASTSPGMVTYNNLVAGQHTFTVRAVDTQGNKDASPATFSWTVLTPTQATQKLINTINGMQLPTGTTTSLEAPLNAAITQLNANNHIAACNQLTAFLNQVSAKQTSGLLTSQQAADLRQQATAIQRAIGCSNIGMAASPSGLPLPMP